MKPGFDPTREDAAKSRPEEGEPGEPGQARRVGRLAEKDGYLEASTFFLQAFSEKIFSERNFFGKT